MPTREQYERAIALMEREGNTAARDELIQRASAEMMGEGSTLEKLGAGVQDAVLGAKQFFGKTSPDEVREHNRIANMATGDSLGGRLVRGAGAAGVLAPAMLIPGAQSVGGAALLGATAGALEPVEDENVIGGKVKNAIVGGLTGGVMQKGMDVVLPAAGRVLKRAVGAGRDATRIATQGGRQAIAEEAFTSAIPAADRPAAERTLRGAAAARTAPYATGVSGAPVTSGVALKNDALLGAERVARDMGDIGQPFRQLDQDAAAAQWAHLKGNVGGDYPALKQAAEDIQTKFSSTAKLQNMFDPKDNFWRELQAAHAATDNTAVQKELEGMLNYFAAAKSRGTVEALHKFRMEAMDDALSRLFKSDKKAAAGLRDTIKDLKDTFDLQMDKAMGPGQRWSKYLDQFQTAARSRDQAQAGNELLAELSRRKPTPAGDPILTGRHQQLADAAAETNKFKQPVYSPDAQDAMKTVRQEVLDQQLPYQQGPRNSATAANQNPSNRVLGRALAAQKRENASLPGLTGGIGVALGDPLTMAGAGALKLYDKASLDIAQRLIQLHTNPAEAAQALARSNLAPQMKSAVLQKLQLLAQRAQRPATATAAATMTQE